MTKSERKEIEVQAKFDKLQDKRANMRKLMQERMDKVRSLRDERFERLMGNVYGNDASISKEINGNIERTEHRQQVARAELYDKWNTTVYQDLNRQMVDAISPAQGKPRHNGKKQVSIAPQGPPVLVSYEDPLKRDLVEAHRERVFDRAATVELRSSPHCRSAPEIRYDALSSPAQAPRRTPNWPPKGFGKPTLEPMSWGQVALEGTLCGASYKVTGAQRLRRGGPSVFIPSEADGVQAAGKNVRCEPLGILKGDVAHQGEAWDFRNGFGASSGAPAQDHYTYGVGDGITTAEFPAPKRMFYHMH